VLCVDYFKNYTVLILCDDVMIMLIIIIININVVVDKNINNVVGFKSKHEKLYTLYPLKKHIRISLYTLHKEGAEN